MNNPQDDVRPTLQHFADNIGQWRGEAARLRIKAEQPHAAPTEVLVHVEDIAGEIYREIASFDVAVAGVAKHSPKAAGELAEVGETLRLLLLDITELGTKLYSTRTELQAEPS